MKDRGHLLTEQRNPRSASLDAQPLEDAFDVMNAEHAGLGDAVQNAKADIVAATRLVSEAFLNGGRLLYVGAGTSGRLGVLDAAECPPTFLTHPDMVQGVIAGGDDALKRSIEHAEDSEADGAAAMDDRAVAGRDVVFGIATGGTTPYVHGALRRARQRGAKTVFFACVSCEQVRDDADVSIRVLTGPEVLTGSTRLKAGIATKMVLNIVSTLAMLPLGKMFENLMVDIDAGRCAKLTDRAVRIVMAAAELDREAAARLLDAAGRHAKTAIVMHRCGVARDDARRLLDDQGGSIRRVLAAAES